MARPQKKRGFRPITIDEQHYCWRLNSLSGLIEINAANCYRQRLEVNFGWYDEWLYFADERKPPDFEPRVVTPRFVEKAIRFGTVGIETPLKESCSDRIVGTMTLRLRL